MIAVYFISINAHMSPCILFDSLFLDLVIYCVVIRILLNALMMRFPLSTDLLIGHSWKGSHEIVPLKVILFCFWMFWAASGQAVFRARWWHISFEKFYCRPLHSSWRESMQVRWFRRSSSPSTIGFASLPTSMIDTDFLFICLFQLVWANLQWISVITLSLDICTVWLTAVSS